MPTTVRAVPDVSVPGPPTIHQTLASASRADGRDGRRIPDVSMGSRMTYSRLIGALFLAGFFTYGVGHQLAASVTGGPDFLSTVSAQRTTLTAGAFLMLLNSVVDIGKGVLFFPILECHGKRTALAYLAAMIFEVAVLAVGVMGLLMIVPLGQYAVDAGAANAPWAKALGSLLIQVNTMAYNVGMLAIGLAGVFLWSLGFRVRLLPRWLSAWGVMGYAIFALGAIAEVFGIRIGLMASIPGGLFELGLAFWLLAKGFYPAAYAGSAPLLINPTVRPVPATL